MCDMIIIEQERKRKGDWHVKQFHQKQEKKKSNFFIIQTLAASGIK